MALPNWYVVHCAPQKEAAVANALAERLGFPVFLPTIKRRFRGQIQPTPLFPGYIFVRAELQPGTVGEIEATSGALRLLAFGGLPQAVPQAVLDNIRDKVDRLNEQGGLPEFQFHKGAPVRFAAGPLQGLEAVFLEPMGPGERAKILIDFMGQLRQAEVPMAVLEKARSVPGGRRERRTRGRGRPINRYLSPRAVD
jgi:transcriptional antiterminator RfaH